MVCFPHRRERPGKQRLQQGQGRSRRRPAAQEKAERGGGRGHPCYARAEGVAEIGVFSLFGLVVSLSTYYGRRTGGGIRRGVGERLRASGSVNTRCGRLRRVQTCCAFLLLAESAAAAFNTSGSVASCAPPRALAAGYRRYL